MKNGLLGDRCNRCNGSGTVVISLFEQDCPDCRGTGVVNSPNACKECHGSGTVTSAELAAEIDCPRCNGTGIDPGVPKSGGMVIKA